MKLVDIDNPDGTMKLSDLHYNVNRSHAFLFDRHRYVVVQNDSCRDMHLNIPRGMFLCFNLKSHTLRCLQKDTMVQPMKAEVRVREGKQLPGC